MQAGFPMQETNTRIATNNPSRTTAGVSAARRSEAGLSLIEVLFATALLLGIALGLLGLFVNSARGNTYGTESTVVNNLTKGEVEELIQVPLNHPDLTVSNGNTEETIADVFLQEDPRHLSKAEWISDPSAADPGTLVKWRRVSLVRHLAYDDIFEGTANVEGTTLIQLGHPDLFDSPLDGSAREGKLHMKEISSTVEGLRQAGPLGVGQEWTVQRFRSF